MIDDMILASAAEKGKLYVVKSSGNVENALLLCIGTSLKPDFAFKSFLSSNGVIKLCVTTLQRIK